jgi:hypothetical protein
MPFRRWLEARGAKYPAVYSNAMLALGVVVCMFIVITISVQINNRTLARERAASEQARHAFCVVVATMVDTYEGIIPPTKGSLAVTAAWRDLESTFRCV